MPSVNSVVVYIGGVGPSFQIELNSARQHVLCQFFVNIKSVILTGLLSFIAAYSTAQTIFVEAEEFAPSSDGWKINKNPQTRGASSVMALNGASGDAKATAETMIEIPADGEYRIWVRHNYNNSRPGPFRLTVNQANRSVGEKVFDLKARPGERDWHYVWDSFDAKLSAGDCRLVLGKHEEKNCSGYVRNVDCVLLTTDKDLKPDHTRYGPQTWMRVTLADIYEKPLQIHIFADHHRSPWYGHWHLSKAGTLSGLRPTNDQLLASGERTPWCNITPMLYQDTGAILNISARYTYHVWADRLKGRFEFATAPDESAIVRTMEVDSRPNGLVVIMPPNLLTPENLQRFKRDRDFAEATGRIADAFDWPTIGKKPEQIPFFVSATVGGYGTKVDQAIEDREWKTLGYFGFSNLEKPFIHGRIWRGKNGSFCEPDFEVMRRNAALYAAEFQKSGKQVEDIVFCMLTDEPTGQPSAFMAKNEAYHAAFRTWLKKLGKTPADLKVADWDAVKPVPESTRDDFPGLHYFTQRFRTRALGDFMATQRGILESAYGRSLPTLVNFSDGATYQANFYAQGVDYFELLDADDQNAIWGEDWANGSSSYQCGAYNVDLMRAAAHERGQTIGHYLIAHANRKPWDIKLKAAGETARGVKIWKNFSYGVSWGSHEGGPSWKSHTWYSRPETWRANAEVVREIGGAEDLLVDAVAKPAEVAILYSSSSDIWTVKRSNAYGFNRMHTWMALAHAQVPVDFIGERQVERDGLAGYRVCYLSGPNLTRAAAVKLKNWVEQGGVLFMTAGAASRDEYNELLDTFASVLPAEREEPDMLQAFLGSGAYLQSLAPKGMATIGGVGLEVLSVRQKLKAEKGATVLGTFEDGSPALIHGAVGKGTIYCAGFLPALDYIKKAQKARRVLEQARDAAQPPSEHPAPPVIFSAADLVSLKPKNRLERSLNPWEFPADVRDVLLTPVRAAKIDPPVVCSVPLVDAVPLHADRGIVIPLANYTLERLGRVDFTVRVDHPVDRIETVHLGRIKILEAGLGRVRFSIPLDASDYVKIYYQ